MKNSIALLIIFLLMIISPVFAQDKGKTKGKGKTKSDFGKIKTNANGMWYKNDSANINGFALPDKVTMMENPVLNDSILFNILQKNEQIYRDSIRKEVERMEADSMQIDLNVKTDIVREDTTGFNEGDGEEIVTIEEFITIDSMEIKVKEYYSIWDTKLINPYDFDIKNFKDTLPIQLFDKQDPVLEWSSPLRIAKINSEFGFRRYRWHSGIDLDLNVGDSVFSSFAGIIRIRQYSKYGYGNVLVVRHNNGLETLYGHLSKPLKHVGDTVKAGELIGLGGNTGRSTGPHLHYEVRYKGYAFNPQEIWDFKNNTIKMDLFYLRPDHYKHLTMTPSKQGVYHTIKNGETLGGIASRYRISVTTLCKLNGISTRTVLRVGRKLRVR